MGRKYKGWKCSKCEEFRMSRECLGVRVGCGLVFSTSVEGVEGLFRLALVIRVSEVRDGLGKVSSTGGCK